MVKRKAVRSRAAATPDDVKADRVEANRGGSFPIVGVGASAGGLEAFSELLEHLAPDTGMGFVLVQHLDPQHESALTSLLQRKTSVPVQEVTNNLRVKANHVYVQVDASFERPMCGLGIGLTLVRTLVEMHGGTVNASSAGLGRGTEFVVRLPILAATPDPEVARAEDALPPSPPRRILVVDDNKDSAESLALLLSLRGHVTARASDGLEAVELAATFLPDVVLLDIGLPGLNGYETARRIRQQARDTKLILVALTGWGRDEDRRRSQEAGFDAHLVKPLDETSLMKVLEPAPLR